ncbi:aldose 1-epimerase family protein [Rhizobium sp. TH2]|uniref:aldose 1-epimerase family protein n=1 Tax=Rhizobium sp. TH2 TaxID=2775403 RepID=UPI002157B768|nr:aldose 1-epimerase family protein [Rhizobium sp. TH2]UVC09617.1 aldose 1-epimerase family protein [Rhizobium sp. TH2]
MAEITRIANDALAVEVSSLGAETQSLKSSDGRSWLWHGDAAFWNGRSPILFPIVGKAADNTALVDGKPFEMQQHGFARRQEWELAETGETFCLHELVSTEASKAAYPFDFRLTLRHAIEGRKLTVTAEVSNTGSSPLPFGLGFHPAFAWPLPGAEGREHTVVLDNKAEPPLVRIDNGLRKPGSLASPFKAGQLVLNHSYFEEDAMIFPEGAGAGLTYAADGGPSLHFTFENLPNLALWTKPGAPFICVEPWHGTAPEIGASAEIADRPYSLELAPGKSVKFAFSVEVVG